MKNPYLIIRVKKVLQKDSTLKANCFIINLLKVLRTETDFKRKNFEFLSVIGNYYMRSKYCNKSAQTIGVNTDVKRLKDTQIKKSANS